MSLPPPSSLETLWQAPLQHKVTEEDAQYCLAAYSLTYTAFIYQNDTETFRSVNKEIKGII